MRNRLQQHCLSVSIICIFPIEPETDEDNKMLPSPICSEEDPWAAYWMQNILQEPTAHLIFFFFVPKNDDNWLVIPI